MDKGTEPLFACYISMTSLQRVGSVVKHVVVVILKYNQYDAEAWL